MKPFVSVSDEILRPFAYAPREPTLASGMVFTPLYSHGTLLFIQFTEIPLENSSSKYLFV